jgi:short-subunit dehydrogenase
MQLKGCSILLTGGTGGLGVALRVCLIQQGATVISVGRDESDDIRADLSSADEVTRLCEQLAAMPIDIVIHNAGLQYFGRTHEQPEALINAMVAVNLQTPLQLTRALLPGMLARGRGQIVSVGSVFATIPFAHFGTYCATKGGMRAFTQSLRREYAGRGITVTYAAPRAMRTSMSVGLVAEFLKRTNSATDDPATTAAKIVRAIALDKREITIGLSEGILSRLSALCPSFFDIALRKTCNIAEEILSFAAH